MSTIRIERALLSVSDKRGIVDFARGLAQRGVELVCTEGTGKMLREAGLEITSIESVTGSPEWLDGAIKTLHREIHAALLADRDQPAHLAQLAEHHIQPIDLVCVNIPPFDPLSAQLTEDEDPLSCVDVGGGALARAAARNSAFVAVVTDPAQYDAILAEMEAGDGQIGIELRRELAAQAFTLTAQYDTAVSAYLASQGEGVELPDPLVLTFSKQTDLRYGENPHQSAAAYIRAGTCEAGVSTAKLLPGGKPISFNNLMDTNAAFELVKEFSRPAAVVVKHMNPCGCAVNDDLREAYRRAYLGDPVSAFGSILAFNRPVFPELAEDIAESYSRFGKATGRAIGFFAEVVIAPEIHPDAVEILRTRKRWGQEVRLMATGPILRGAVDAGEFDLRCVVGGLLVQNRDLVGWERDHVKCVTDRKANENEMRDLELAWLVAKHVKSNTIVVAKDETVLGVGAGQMNRLDSGMLALRQAGERAKGAVMASDAFFPAADSVNQAAEAGIAAIVQPGGSKKDGDSIEACNKNGISMIFTGKRHFLH